MVKQLSRTLALLVALLAASASLAGNKVDEQFGSAANLFAQGDYERAAQTWQELARTRSLTPEQRLRAAFNFAATCQHIGLFDAGIAMLKEMESLLTQHPSEQLQAQFDQRLGNLYVATHRHRDAVQLLEHAAASGALDAHLRASVLNDLGNAFASEGRPSDALAAHLRAIQLARGANANSVLLNAAINAARLQWRTGAIADARAMLTTIDQALETEPESYERSLALLSASEIERQLKTRDRSLRSEQWLAAAERYATQSGNERLRSLALGYRGIDLLAEGAWTQAEAPLRQALFFAAQLRSNDLAYRWHWRLAQSLLRQQRVREALDEFDRSLAALAPLRSELTHGYHATDDVFEREIKPIYVEFVDALLHGADADDSASRSYLDRALATVESLKSAELQDYFRDACVVAQEAQAQPIDQIATNVAVLYPIVLPDRIELLLRVRGTLIRRSVVLDQATLSANVLQLRELIQQPDSARYLPYARRLHRWLIEPVEAQINSAEATTLVIVPDGILRIIPFAVLHDGNSYLVQTYALATTPSLTLIAPQPLRSDKPQALLTGVAASVQGFAPLPNVSQELTGIRKHVTGDVLLDRDYTTAKLSAALTRDEYAIVHMATHSVIGDTPADSFLLTYDGRLSMADLERLLSLGRFRRQPVELLTLSACETAIGDERAALGLAGIALKAGARSAVATLWRVSDDATATLMSEFYSHLTATERVSKAQALRAAQVQMLRNETSAHPANWAAFLLIGNWL